MFLSALQFIRVLFLVPGLLLTSYAQDTYKAPQKDDICLVPDQWKMLTLNQSVVDEVYFPEKYSLIHSEAKSSRKLNYRLDFASADAGARVVASAPNIKGVKAIQRVSHETYMMSECDDPVWVVVALPERLSVEYVVFEIAESFSSYFRKIAILGATSYPTKQWRLLAVIEVNPDRVSNVFDLRPTCEKFQGGTCWVSHIKFQVLSYQPNDPANVCTLSRFSVYGSTIMQGLETKMKKPEVINEHPVTARPASKSVKSAIPKDSSFESPFANVAEPITIPVNYPFALLMGRKMLEEDHCLTDIVAGIEGQMPRNTLRSRLENMMISLYDESTDVETLKNIKGDDDMAVYPVDQTFVHGVENGKQPCTLNSFQMNDESGIPSISGVLERIITDSILLEQKTRLSSVPSADELPPIIKLVDRLNDVQKALAEHVNRTMVTTVIVKNLAMWLNMMNGEVDLMKEDVQENLKSQMEFLARHVSSIKIPEFMRRLTRRACADSFVSYSLIESVETRNDRRTVCVLSGIYGAAEKAGASRVSLGEIESLLVITESGTMIREWKFSYVLNLYLDNLRQSFLRSPMESDTFYRSNPTYRCAQLYLESLASLYWPATFLHIFPLPSWSTCHVLFKHPLVIYWAIVVFELFQVFGTMVYTISSAVIYAFVVSNAYLYVQARGSEEALATESADSESGDPHSSSSSSPPSEFPLMFRQQYDHLVKSLKRVRHTHKQPAYRRLQSK